MTGEIGETNGSTRRIISIMFHTNLASYGPYGTEGENKVRLWLLSQPQGGCVVNFTSCGVFMFLSLFSRIPLNYLPMGHFADEVTLLA